ncbi:cytochrome P450 [Annulohypoxylon truncatum]|uniref:cytochrome P450 n=1 Tax=Annulohypoxylon truncatum TaxID=327061 RepID=UPI002007AA12|nr:cytochrome P450 [Annulohypoxylon truncatum]KAI1208578.1 cytochrome P450 [Annulohypoxylon truncatum]
MDYAELLTVRPWIIFLSATAGVWIIYQLCNILYNISPLHPLSHIPGPWLARATYLPEFYYDLIKYGRYTKQIQKMHEKYGPIIRISPDEVHCSDINFVDEIYAVGNRKRNKPLHLISGSAHTESAFGTMDHNLHRVRRGPVAKFFARGMISRLEDDIHKLAQVLCDKLLHSGDSPIDVVVAYSCFASDAISSYCFGESFGFLDQEGWYPNFHVPEVAILKPVFALRFFPILRHLFSLGDYFMDYLPADFALLIRTLRVEMPKKVKNMEAEINSGVVRDRPTIFSSLLQLSPEEKEPLDLSDEAAALLGAGTITASWTLSIITYQLLTKPEMMEKLTEELKGAVDDPRHLPAWNVLESLPYLDGVVQEGLRLSYGVSARSPRVATEEDLIYRGEWNKKPVEYVIPKGYAIGMSCVISHHNEDIFPDSHAFIPERWMDAENKKLLDRGMFAFSKGSRSCLGMNLALCEIYVALAALTLRVFPQARLYETTEEDITYDHDMFVPMPKAGSKGVRIIISTS